MGDSTSISLSTSTSRWLLIDRGSRERCTSTVSVRSGVDMLRARESEMAATEPHDILSFATRKIERKENGFLVFFFDQNIISRKSHGYYKPFIYLGKIIYR
jgi:hypothetical protein